MKKLLLILFIAPMLVMPAYAQELYGQAAEEFGLSSLEYGLSGEELAMTGRAGTEETDTRGFFSRLWVSFRAKVREEVRASLFFASALLAVAVLAAVASGAGGASEAINISACASAAMAVLGDVNGMVTETVRAMTRLSDYSKAAMPIIFTAAAASGQPGASAAKYAAVSLVMDVVMTLSQKLIIPGVFVFIAFSLTDKLFPNPFIACLERGSKWVVTTALTFMTIGLSAYIGTTGLVAGSVDAAAVRATKTILSSALPVVGSIISDASGAVLSAAGVIKYSAGAFALTAICAVCAAPVAVIGVRLVILKLFAAFADAVPGVNLGKLLDRLGTAMGMLLGLLGCSAIMLFISVTAGIKAVGA